MLDSLSLLLAPPKVTVYNVLRESSYFSLYSCSQRETHAHTEVRGCPCSTQLGSYFTGFQRLALHYSLKLMEKLQVRYKIAVHYFFFWTFDPFEAKLPTWCAIGSGHFGVCFLVISGRIVRKWWALPVGSYRWCSGSTHHCWWHTVWWLVKRCCQYLF